MKKLIWSFISIFFISTFQATFLKSGDIKNERMGIAGEAVKSDFKVTDNTGVSMSGPRISANRDGKAVIIWGENRNNGQGDNKINIIFFS